MTQIKKIRKGSKGKRTTGKRTRKSNNSRGRGVGRGGRSGKNKTIRRLRRKRRGGNLPNSEFEDVDMVNMIYKEDDYKTHPLHEGHTECIICMEKYKEGEPVSELKCHHLFHTKCIIQSLELTKDECPFCGKKIKIPKDTYFIFMYKNGEKYNFNNVNLDAVKEGYYGLIDRWTENEDTIIDGILQKKTEETLEAILHPLIDNIEREEGEENSYFDFLILSFYDPIYSLQKDEKEDIHYYINKIKEEFDITPVYIRNREIYYNEMKFMSYADDNNEVSITPELLNKRFPINNVKYKDTEYNFEVEIKKINF